MGIHARSAQDGIVPVARGSFEAVEIQAMLLLQMVDVGFHRSHALQTAAKATDCPAPASFVHLNLNLTRLFVAPITHTHNHILRMVGNPLD